MDNYSQIRQVCKEYGEKKYADFMTNIAYIKMTLL